VSSGSRCSSLFLPCLLLFFKGLRDPDATGGLLPDGHTAREFCGNVGYASLSLSLSLSSCFPSPLPLPFPLTLPLPLPSPSLPPTQTVEHSCCISGPEIIAVCAGGKIGLIDFGQSKQLPDKDRIAFARLVLELAKGYNKVDYDVVARRAADLGLRFGGDDPKTITKMSFGMFDTNNSYKWGIPHSCRISRDARPYDYALCMLWRRQQPHIAVDADAMIQIQFAVSVVSTLHVGCLFAVVLNPCLKETEP
jgi:hypothetical protein